ncbi:MAG: DUF3320 domain-containing protein [Myxococcota bacterium]
MESDGPPAETQPSASRTDAENLTDLELVYEPSINWALYQNGVSVIRHLALTNRGAVPLRNVELRLRAEPEIASTSVAKLDRLDPGTTHAFDGFDLALVPGRLAGREERLRGRIELEVISDGRVLRAETRPITIYAHNEWAGVAALPELLAAFVQPNHPRIPLFLDLVRKHMQAWTQDPSLNGYQSGNPVRVRQLAAAVYAALQSRDITYVNPPASFERSGQKIRNPEEILSSSMGTCLDLAVIGAACLEAVGLHPLLFVVEGHAFCGVWLEESSFPEPTMGEALAITKRSELGEITAFDPTTATRRPIIGFADSERAAQRELADQAKFLCAIDVFCARRYGAGIRPLASGAEAMAGAEAARPHDAVFSGPEVNRDLELRRRASTTSRGARAGAAGTVEARLDQWRARLLDLTRRNRLINYKPTKASVPLLVHDAGAVEDALADGLRLAIHPKPDIRTPDGRPMPSVDPKALHGHLESELALKRLRADLPAGDLEGRLVGLYRKARTSLEEGGANTLYLAVGFLEWTEPKSKGEPQRAPILLLPLELHRERIGHPLQISLGDDEPMLNVTLLEKLRSDYGIASPELYELPTDDSGLDIPLILRRFKEAVRDQSGWRVVDDAHISVFTFSKHLMWSDLTSRIEEIKANPQVAAILSGRAPEAPSGPAAPTAATLDQHVHPNRQFCPLDADSTQLEAVFAAAAGRSFVLEGPPGTGKSQTITNLIAQCLASGQRVLFVSEKMAALSVVHRRLESIGLGPFCLELHSNSASKLEIIGQLIVSLDANNGTAAANWEERARELSELRGHLNGLADGIGRRRPFGLSVFDATSRLIGLQGAAKVDIRWAQRPDSVDASWRQGVLAAASALGTAASATGTPSTHPWRGADAVRWQPVLENDLKGSVAATGQAVRALYEASRGLGALLGFEAANLSAEGLKSLRGVAESLATCPGPPAELMRPGSWVATRDDLAATAAVGRQRKTAWASVAERWTPDALKMAEIPALRARYRRWAGAFALFAFFMLWTAKAALRRVAKAGTVPPPRQTLEDLERLGEVKQLDNQIEQGASRAATALGALWRGRDSDWQAIDATLSWVNEFRRVVARFRPFVPKERQSAVSERLTRLTTHDFEGLARGLPDGDLVHVFLEAAKRADATMARLSTAIGMADGAWSAADEPYCRSVVARLSGMNKGLDRLRDWSHYLEARRVAREHGLEALVTLLEGGELRPDQVADAGDQALHFWWLGAVMAGEPVLSGFNRLSHDKRVQRFRELDQALMALATDEIRARVAQHIPKDSTPSHGSSELSLLLREGQKKSRHMPLRKLFQQIPSLLGRLKPCLLMSPLSVAQYLDPKMPAFDLVVFDEASQIPAWDAIGAIARGNQLVVVGDPKQLPPTNFFQKMESDEAVDDNDFEELESILNECLASGMQQRHLGWHYRSRHESLIAFSNHHYYGGRLLTFPSAEAEVPSLGVKWQHVPDGHYDRGGTRTNVGEARALVDDVVRRLRDPEEARRSIGVVTFSTAQQALIEKLLDKKREELPEIEQYFQDSAPERIFVKNLESVQGDERDVILFSICYAHDAKGQMFMNFGPLNRDGGERRLNVAVTRAREQLVVFSSLTPDQIDLRRTSAVAVKHLAHFLRYAAHGPKAIDAATQVHYRLESPFEEQVCKAMLAKGWDVDSQVGCSGYRIDLAVRDPKLPGRYLLGVECDGASYHSSKNARDRDRLREQVLTESYGWTLHRIWSTDWWHNPAAEMARLDESLERARLAPTAKRPEPRTVPAAAAPSSSAEPGLAPRPYASRPVTAPPAGISEIVARYQSAPDIRDTPSALEGAAVYVFADLRDMAPRPADDFHDARFDRVIVEQVLRIVREEAPIHLDFVARPLIAVWGLSRRTKRVQERVATLVGLAMRRDPAIVLQGDFVWKREMLGGGWRGFRYPAESDEIERRDASMIPSQEIANAARAALKVHRALPADALVVDLSRIFGFAQTGSRVRAAMEAGIEHLLASGEAVRRGELIELESTKG